MTEGITPSERYLQKLGEKSFLSLWSHPNPYTDEGRRNGKGDGKELCDLLVIFGDSIVLFSDKYVGFNQKLQVKIAWQRWYKRAISKSAKQLRGANSWLRRFPKQVFQDRQCTIALPVPLPAPDQMRTHMVCVASGALEACKNYFGGDGTGSLFVDSSIAGDNDHFNKPFHVGHVISANDFVHVFEEFSLDAVFDEVNTITDFLAYLEKRESFLTQDSLPVLAAGEEHLLSIYLTKMNQDDEHDFVVPCAPEGGSSDHVYIDVGFWEEMQQNPLYKSKKDADQISYLWDELIERFIKLGTPNRGGNPDFEPGLRLMASESRVRRRELASAFYGVVARGVSMARVSYSDAFTDRGYVFLALAVPEDSSYEEYREFRRNMLHAYCLVAKLRCHNAQHMIGIATEPSSSHGSSEDLLVLDVSDWTPARRREAKQLQSEFGLLEDKRVVTRRGTTMEYPEPLQNDVERQRADSPLVSRSKAKQKRKKRTARASRRRNRR